MEQSQTTQSVHIRNDEAAEMPAMVLNNLKNFTEQQQEEFMEEFRRKKKNMAGAYLTWLFGFHYVYLERWSLFIIFLITLGGFFLWWLIDAFTMKGIVDDKNKDVAAETFRIFKSIY